MGTVSNSYNESDGLLLNRTCKEPMPLLPSVRFHAGSPGMHAFPLPRSLARHETPQASNNTQTTPSGNYRIQPNMSTEYCTTAVLTGSISRQYNKEFTRRECGGYLLLYLILTCLYRLHPNALQTVPPRHRSRYFPVFSLLPVSIWSTSPRGIGLFRYTSHYYGVLPPLGSTLTES